ncbi:MAG: metallophosphoesterase [Clostridia bacterium]|nr:metallophosphoesterase [Clostridia bacterium]
MRMQYPRLTTYHIDAPVSPLRIALLTDLHNGKVGNPDALFEQAKPDVICISGDVYEAPPRHKYFAFSNVEAVLALCEKTAPTFYSRGNHDKTSCPEVDALLSMYHITEVTDRAVSFGDVRIGGLGSAYYEEDTVPNMAFAKQFAAEEGYKILICHHPEYYRRHLKELNIPLILSGHNHGGQWAIGKQGVYVPGQGLFPPHCAGVFDGRLVVSRGIYNNVVVPRIFCPTELVLIELNHTVSPDGKE